MIAAITNPGVYVLPVVAVAWLLIVAVMWRWRDRLTDAVAGWVPMCEHARDEASQVTER